MKNRGSITIDHNNNGTITLNIELINQDVWLSRYEIADLLSLNIKNITANINQVYKNEELFRFNTEKEVRGVQYYNLDLIIALTFRCKGGYCRPIREWIRERIKKPLTTTNQSFVLNISSKNNGLLS